MSTRNLLFRVVVLFDRIAFSSLFNGSYVTCQGGPSNLLKMSFQFYCFHLNDFRDCKSLENK